MNDSLDILIVRINQFTPTNINNIILLLLCGCHFFNYLLNN